MRHNLPVKYASSGESKALSIIRYDLTRAYVNSSVAFTPSCNRWHNVFFFLFYLFFLTMKFAEHLSAHITPEWRKQYINYEVSFQYWKFYLQYLFFFCMYVYILLCIYTGIYTHTLHNYLHYLEKCIFLCLTFLFSYI